MLVERQTDRGIAQLTLNRHERRNALGTAMMTELAAHLDALSADNSTRAIILTGSGGIFCAGSDLKELAALDISSVAQHEAETAAIVRQILTCPRPIIAAVEGYALGGGCALALACDVVIAASNARLAMPEVANGWIPPWGLTAIRRRGGDIAAQRLIWGAEAFTVAELASMKLVDRICGEGEALAQSTELAHSLASLPPAAVAATKRFFSDAIPAKEEDAISSQLFDENCATAEAKATFAKFSHK